MNIIKQKWIFLNSTLVVVPKQVSRLYKFGVQVLAFREIISLRANARIPNLNWYTAKSKVYRLTSNKKLLSIFPLLLKELSLVSEKDIIAVDFSDFGNNTQVLMFAKQTKQGRAMPVYFETLKYPIKKGSQNIFIIQAIKNLEAILGFKVKLVFDRGFACPSIIRYLLGNKDIFYIRIKKGKMIKTNKKALVKDLSSNDYKSIAYHPKIKNKLRLVISDKSGECNEPWYIITNDNTSSRKRVIQIYYYRFEIEEFFRDAKRIFGLEYINFKKQISLQIILWFAILGIWFVWNIEMKIQDKDKKDKMQLSIIRYYLEKIQSEIIQIAEGSFMRRFLLNSG